MTQSPATPLRFLSLGGTIVLAFISGILLGRCSSRSISRSTSVSPRHSVAVHTASAPSSASASHGWRLLYQPARLPILYEGQALELTLHILRQTSAAGGDTPSATALRILRILPHCSCIQPLPGPMSFRAGQTPSFRIRIDTSGKRGEVNLPFSVEIHPAEAARPILLPGVIALRVRPWPAHLRPAYANIERSRLRPGSCFDLPIANLSRRPITIRRIQTDLPGVRLAVRLPRIIAPGSTATLTIHVHPDTGSATSGVTQPFLTITTDDNLQHTMRIPIR